MGEGERLVRERLMELRALCRRFGVAQLELFGSALRDDFDFATSDLDFLVRLEPPAGVGYADAYFGLKETLSKSSSSAPSTSFLSGRSRTPT